MKLSELYNKNIDKNADIIATDANAMHENKCMCKKPVISIEIFPPKADAPKENVLSDSFEYKQKALFEELKFLNENFQPSLVSVTYGADGKNRENSNIITKSLMENFNFDIVMPHFTCVCSNKEFIENYLKEIESYKIQNILALRGDEPEDIEICYRDFKFAYQLVEFIKQKTELEIAVAGYPEGHILAESKDIDIKNLKTKLNAGGGAIFTQFFFENEKFYNYLECLNKHKINVPVCAGLLPVISYSGLMKMVNLSGIKLSKKAQNHFERWQNSKEDTIKAGIEWTSYQVEDLIKNGVDGIHFYTLNKAHSTVEILKNTGFARVLP